MHHTCHAVGCSARCKPEFLMCRLHWLRVPVHLQSAVYAHYRPGQCDDMNVTKEWHVAATMAINAVAVLEGRFTQAEAAKRLQRIEDLYRKRDEVVASPKNPDGSSKPLCELF